MKTAKKFGSRYPWRRWFAQGKTRIRQGEHYRCRTDSMAQAARFAAKRLGVHLSIRIAQDAKSLTLYTFTR